MLTDTSTGLCLPLLGVPGHIIQHYSQENKTPPALHLDTFAIDVEFQGILFTIAQPLVMPSSTIIK
jgi:hypothetical protein